MGNLLCFWFKLNGSTAKSRKYNQRTQQSKTNANSQGNSHAGNTEMRNKSQADKTAHRGDGAEHNTPCRAGL